MPTSSDNPTSNSDTARNQPSPPVAVRADELQSLPRITAVVDARQDQLMAGESADGGPPSHHQRVIEWRWVAVGLPVLILAGAAWAAIAGVSLGAVAGFGAVFLLLLLLGCWPVLGAGLLRGKEQAIARDEALAELPGSKSQ
ncbi:MAG: hypothetical protein ACREJO_12285 [Phycisphaerales bacterium]